MRNIVKGTMVAVMLLILAGPAAAGQIFYQINEVLDHTYPAFSDPAEEVTVDGAYVVCGSLNLENSFSGWGDLGSYSELAATLTFTWHDDTYSWTGPVGQEGLQTGQTTDPTDPPGGPWSPAMYDDNAIVTLDGTQAFSNVEVGEANSTAPTVYEFALTDLSLLDDGTLNVLIEAGYSGYSRSDFIVDSVALEITGTTSAVPVPAAVWLLGSGIAGLGILRRKQRV